MTDLPLVPAPLSVTPTDGPGYVLGPRTRVVAGTHPEVASAVAHRLSRLAGFAVPVTANGADEPDTVVLRLVDDAAALGLPDAGLTDAGLTHAGLTHAGLTHAGLTPERAAGAYRVEVTERRVTLTALAVDGLLHAATVLEQLAVRDAGRSPDPGPSPDAAPDAPDATPDADDAAPAPDPAPAPDSALAPVRLPAVVVVDAPRFGWRGLSVDVARHFFGPEVLRTVVDVMANLRLNVLHLHLTDDQGWRLDVPSRPQLVDVASKTAVGDDPGGYYTVDDLAELTAYARGRGITVVPEIDLPGHVNAALHALGELTPSGEPADPYTGIEVGFSRLHADLPTTEPFLRDVLTDVAALTPGPYVHIGGDEVHTMERAEYARLVETAARVVEGAGKTVVGWQEVAKATLTPGTVVQLWDERDGAELVRPAVEAGALLLLSPASKVYLDLKYDAHTPIGLEWAGHVELRDSYDWDPLAVVPGVPESSVVGIEAALWTETVRTPDDLFFLLLPRLAAVAEVAWSQPDRRSWEDFGPRVRHLARAWDRAGLPWYRSPQIPW
ncbi:beta-N-acetylhexosaminidase [Cellulomonas cellasea]|uniref:beta-N-acetylhexosaminidase n=1 Tax=Cellulomonas cellasea TaxID=43670 RepID=A0A7W4UIK3_9CELL|nr:beta-N-acetylhexosaminidase [Cellulomonas cellasea]MBB2924484.1 hexosaminidase [Cellulomonas cellasea]